MHSTCKESAWLERTGRDRKEERSAGSHTRAVRAFTAGVLSRKEGTAVLCFRTKPST